MLKYLMLKRLWKKIFPKPEYEWYCTRCGFNDIQHESVGKLKGSCPINSEYACPLDIRIKQ
jgi:hypothetical protein